MLLSHLTLSLPVCQENPYVMRKSNHQDFQGNDQYEGFCVDMLRELADILKFSFKIKLVDDGLYGAPEPNGSWTGMVGELINRVSGLACCRVFRRAGSCCAAAAVTDRRKEAGLEGFT